MVQSILELPGNLLEIVMKSFDYFRKNPSHLAWAMMHYQLMHIAGGQMGYDFGNDAMSIISAGEKMDSNEDAGLLYDAWEATLSDYHEFPDTHPGIPLESKINKTMDEWVAVLTDPKYVLKEAYPDTFAVRNELLCADECGLSWHNGFLAPIGPNGTDKTLFAGYTRAWNDVQPLVRSLIIRLTFDSRIKEAAQAYLGQAQKNAQRIYSGENWQDVLLPADSKRKQLKLRMAKLDEELRDKGLNPDSLVMPEPELQREYCSLTASSKLVTMPSKVHSSYIVAGKEIATAILGKDPSDIYAKQFLQRLR